MPSLRAKSTARPPGSTPPSWKKKVEQEDNTTERPPPPIPWGSRAPRPWRSRAPSEKNKVEQEEDKKTKQKEDTEKSGVTALVCLDSDTSDDEEQKEKDMAVDHRQKEGEAVVKCEAYRAAESRADMLKEKARQLKATKHWAPVPGEKEFENVRRMSIAATQREEAQMRTPSPQRGRAPSRSRAPSPERREPHSEAIARAACRAASANRSSNDRRPEMPLPIRGVPAPDDTSDVPPGYFEKKKKKVQVEQQKDKDPSEALQKREAQANRADTSIVTNAQTLLEFLTYVVRQTWIVRSSEYHATEQAQSSGHATEQTQSQRHDEDCANIVFDTIKNVTYFGVCFYDQSALLVHKQMLDIMSRNKEGLAKENMFIEWCRRVQKHTEAPSTAVPSTDTEHVFKSLALDLLSNDLTPEQRRNPAYKVIKDKKTGAISVTTKQRSWINVILRKNLGHSRVAYYIFNHGVPALFNLPFRREAPSIREHHHRKQLGRNWEDARCSDLRVPQQ